MHESLCSSLVRNSFANCLGWEVNWRLVVMVWNDQVTLRTDLKVYK